MHVLYPALLRPKDESPHLMLMLKWLAARRGKIVDGRIQKFLSEQALLDQAFIKDTSKTVATVIKEATATVGEKVSIRRFER